MKVRVLPLQFLSKERRSVPELVYGGVESADTDGVVNANSNFLAHG